MATFQVMGPCRVHIGLAGGATTELGETDNDDLIELSLDDSRQDVKAVTTGMQIATSVWLGRTATLTMTLCKWDIAQQLWENAPGGTEPGDPGVIGTRYITGSEYFKVEIRRVAAETVDVPGYTFGRCILRDWRVFDWGNREKRLSLNWTAHRDGSTGALADGSSQASALWVPIEA